MRRIAALATVLAFATNCASIVHGTRQEIPVQSNPSGADVAVKCADGEFNAAPTPTELILKRNRGGCQVTVSKKGYESKTVRLKRKLSGWYLGNILIGGLVGLIIDAADGAMFTQSPGEIFAALVPTGDISAPTAPPRPTEPSPQEAGDAPAAPPASEPPAQPVPEPKVATTPETPRPVPPAPESVRPDPTTSLPVQEVRGVKDAWKVVVTSDSRSADGCKPLGSTSKLYDISGAFRIGELKEEVASLGGNLAVVEATNRPERGQIFSCPLRR